MTVIEQVEQAVDSVDERLRTEITELKHREEQLLRENAELQERLRERAAELARALEDVRSERVRRREAEELLRMIGQMAAGAVHGAAPERARTPSQPPELTRREAEVLRLYALGNSRKAIAEQLHISVKTVETHKINSMKKLSLRRRADVVRYAVAVGWL